MSMVLKRRDLYAGLLMVFVGIGTVLQARVYEIGTLTHMGPGFLPQILGVILVLLGVCIGFAAPHEAVAETGLAIPGETTREAFDLRGGLAIASGVFAFIVLGAYAGLVPATFACVFIAALGDRSGTWKGALLLAAVVTVAGCVLFVYVFKIFFPLFRW